MIFAIDVPVPKKIHLIENSDAESEADDQYAIVHALLESQFIIKGLFGTHFGEERSKAEGGTKYEHVVTMTRATSLDLMRWIRIIQC